MCVFYLSGQYSLREWYSFWGTGQNDYGLFTGDSSGSVTIRSGTISAGDVGVGLFTQGSGSVTVSGGIISAGSSGTGLEAGGNESVTVSGGTFTVGQYGLGLEATDSGSVMVTGGTFSASDFGTALGAADSGSVMVAGGTFTTGQYGSGLGAFGSGVIDLFGSGFSYTVDGQTTQITSGALPSDPNNGVTGTLSGTLLDGQALDDTTFRNYATIEVNVGTPPVLPTPEPSGFVGLSIGLLGLGALGVKARRRTA